MNSDVFLISAEAEYTRTTRLLNKSGKAFWALKDQSTQYAKMLYALYVLNKRVQLAILSTIQDYKHGKLGIDKESEVWEK